MAVAEVLKSKTLYKMLLYSLKVIPMILASITLVNIITSYFDIDLPILSYLVTGLLIGFVYMAVEVFRFCNYHNSIPSWRLSYLKNKYGMDRVYEYLNDFKTKYWNK